MDVEKELKRGLVYHQEGRLGDAARCYQAVLEADPANVDALNLMSVLANVAGQHQFAADLASQAIAADSTYFAPYIALGNALQALGNLDGAAAAFTQAGVLNDQSAEAFSNLASAQNAAGKFHDGSDSAVRALTLNPDLPEAHNNFGNALAGLDSPAEAAESYAKAVALNPDFAEAWHNLGNARMASGDGDGALEAFAHALKLDQSATNLYDMGTAFLALAQFEPAAKCFAQALELDEGFLDAWMNLAVALKSLGRLDEAEAVQRDAVAKAPDDAEAHFNLAVLLLQQGKYAEGWAEYEWRWGMPEFQPLIRDFGKPRWTGEDLAGRTILITAEQGFGDAIEFCRLVPLVAARGGRVILECRPGLERLFAGLEGCHQVVRLGDLLPAFDLHIPLMSLPLVLGVTESAIPAAVPYLAVPADAAVPPALAKAEGLKVGIAWAGKAARRDNAERSCTLNDLAPLFQVPGITLFSLQVGPQAGLGDWAGRANLYDLAPAITDFADTATAIAALDLVICVDTAVAHLAGALGKPVWLMLSRPSNGFLWMNEREDTPWYPTARLFRQSEPGNWPELLVRVTSELEKMAG